MEITGLDVVLALLLVSIVVLTIVYKYAFRKAGPRASGND